APAGDAGVGFDLDQQDVVGRPVAAAIAGGRTAEGERDLDRDAVDLGDLHAASPLARTSASSRSAWRRSDSRLEVKRSSLRGASSSTYGARMAAGGGGTVSVSGISTSASAK